MKLAVSHRRRRVFAVAGTVLVAAVAVGAFGLSRAGHGAGPGPASISDTGTVAPGVKNPFRIGRTLVIPHAGGDGLFPEDTLFAYKHSMAMGGDVVDVDVAVSSDGVLVAMHDSTVDRTTNGVGRVVDMKYADLAKLDAGYRFRQGSDYPYRGKGVGVPSLESILMAFPDKLVTLDLKDQREEVARPVCDLLRRLRARRTGAVYVGSDSGDQVRALRATCPEVPTSGTDEERQAMRAARAAGDTRFRTRQLVSQPEFINSDGTRRVTKKTLAFSHALNIAVLTWVVDDPEQMRELIALGIDGIYTHRPDVLLQVLGRGAPGAT